MTETHHRRIAMTRASTKLAAYFLPLLIALPVIAQDDADEVFDRTPQDCILSSSIRQTEAVDDQNVLFFMRDRSVYRNHLPRKCPGLEREDRFSYRLDGTRRLCSINTITVIEDSPFGAGVGSFRDGFTCRLGEFVPLSPEEVEDLRREDEGSGRSTQSTIETEEVELPEGETSEQPPADAPAAPPPAAN
jgi:hypothetical protein